MSKFNNIQTSNKMDKVISDAIKQGRALKYKKRRKNIMAASIASLLLVLGLTVVGIKDPSFAEKLPIIGDMIELIQDSMQGGELSDSYTKVNKSCTKNGLTVTVEGAVYSKNQIYMDLELKTDKPFKESAYAEVVSPVKSTDKNPNEKYLNMRDIKFYINGKEVEGYGFESPRFNYVDDYTLKGSVLIDFKSPIKNNNKYDTFKMEFNLDAYIAYDGDKNEYESITPMDGPWILEFPVNSNKEKTKTIKVNKKQDNITVKEVTLTQTALNLKVASERNTVIEFVDIKDDKGNILMGAGMGTYTGDTYDGDYHLNSINQDIKYITVLVANYNVEGNSKSGLTEIKVNLK